MYKHDNGVTCNYITKLKTLTDTTKKVKIFPNMILTP